VTIPPELEAQILRYYHVERWRIGSIARHLRVHPDTVTRVLAQTGLPRIGTPARPSGVDPREVPDPDREPPPHHGPRTRLSRWP
jgi:hypothetical protein